MKKSLALLIATTLMTTTLMAGCGTQVPLAADSFKLELGDKPQNHTSSYVNAKTEKDLNDYKFDFTKVDNMKVGRYDASVTYKGKTKEFTISVEDTTSPEVIFKREIKAGVGVPLYVDDMIDSITELSGKVTISFEDHQVSDSKLEDDKTAEAENTTEESVEKETGTETTVPMDGTEVTETETAENPEVEYKNVAVVYDEAGEYDNTVTIYDEAGNKSKQDIHIVVTDMPIINNVSDIIAEKGSNIDCLYNITATDTSGNDITNQIKVNTDNVDTNTPGEYEITYAVTDENGNTTTVTAKIEIVEDVSSVLDDTSFVLANENGAEKRVATAALGTGKVSEEKPKIREAKVAEDLAAADEKSETDSSNADKKNSTNKSANVSNGASNGSVTNNTSSSNTVTSATSEAGQTESSAASAPAQASEPHVDPQWVGEWSGTNGVLTGEQKAYIDSLIQSWKNGGYTDSGVDDAITNYLFDQGVDLSWGGAHGNSQILVNSLDELKSKQANEQNANCLYHFHATYTDGTYESGYLRGFTWCYMIG